MPKEISNRVTAAVIVGALLAIAIGYVVYDRLHAERNMTLVEALWVCTPDMKTYFAPGSPESLAMIQTLSHSVDTNTFRAPGFICVRMGITNGSLSPDEPIMWDLHPEQIPSSAVQRKRE